jgi:uncharacterized protein
MTNSATNNRMNNATNDATGERRLLHRWRDGEAAIPAFLDDYAFVAWGVFELYQATFNASFLRDAVWLCDEMLRLFFDSDASGFTTSAADNEQLVMRTKEAYDGAMPSGNSMAATVLARVGTLTSNERFLTAARQTTNAFAASIDRHPTGFAQMLIAHDFLSNATQEIIIALPPSTSATSPSSQPSAAQPMTRLIAETYLPFAVVAMSGGANDAMSDSDILTLVEQTQYQRPLQENGRAVATVYVCENYACQAPAMSLDALRERLT